MLLPQPQPLDATASVHVGLSSSDTSIASIGLDRLYEQGLANRLVSRLKRDREPGWKMLGIVKPCLDPL